MFILTPIAINSSLTSKRAHVCSPLVIVASLAVPQVCSFFLFVCSVRIFKRQREREGIETSNSLSACDETFSLHRHYFLNPNSEYVWIFISNMVSNFDNDPIVNASKIVVLLGQFWLYAGKTKSYVQGTFPSSQIFFRKSQGLYEKISYEHGVEIS